MKCIVINHSGGSPYHGPNMRWYYLGRALKSHNVETVIISSSCFHKYFSPPKFEGNEKIEFIDGLRYFWIKTRCYRKRGYSQVLNQFDFVQKALRKIADLSNENPDIVVASSPHPLVFFPAWKLAKQTGAKLIFEVRDLWPLAIQELGSFPFWHPYIVLLKKTERIAVLKSDLIVSVKPGDYEYFWNQYRLSPSRFAYVPNGFLPDQDDSELDVLNNPINKSKEKVIRIGYIGSLSTYYRLNDFINSAVYFVNNNNIEFIIVGDGEKKSELRDLAKKSGATNVKFIGQIQKKFVRNYVKSFDICFLGLEDISANHYGISCNKLFEYMEAAKPIIGSYRTKYDPITKAKCGILTNPDSPGEVVDAIKYLIKNPDIAKKMGENGRNYFLQNHDFSVVSQIYLSCFNKLLGGKNEYSSMDTSSNNWSTTFRNKYS